MSKTKFYSAGIGVVDTSKTRLYWTQEDVTDFLCKVRDAIAPHYHVGLCGSMLFGADRSKDLDIIIYPHNLTTHNNLEEVRVLLREKLDMQLAVRERMVKEIWRKVGSSDTKHVEVWTYKTNYRVDVFFPFPI